MASPDTLVVLLLEAGSHRNALDCCKKLLTSDPSHCQYLIQFSIVQDKMPHFQKYRPSSGIIQKLTLEVIG